MRRIRWIVGVAAATASALVLAAGAGAVETSWPLTHPFENPCTGETLIATGNLVVKTETTVGPDGHFHHRYHASFHGMTASTVATGRKYVVHDQWLEGENSNLDNGQSTTRLRLKIQWVRTGEAAAVLEDDDFYDWWNIHMTTNANGMPTALKIDTEDDVCR